MFILDRAIVARPSLARSLARVRPSRADADADDDPNSMTFVRATQSVQTFGRKVRFSTMNDRKKYSRAHEAIGDARGVSPYARSDVQARAG